MEKASYGSYDITWLYGITKFSRYDNKLKFGFDNNYRVNDHISGVSNAANPWKSS